MARTNSDEDSVPTRPSLIEAVRDWTDAKRWQEFHDTYARLIDGVARSQGLTEMEAQDVVQETLLSVAKTMPDFQYDPARCSFKTWLLHLTRKRIVDQLRRRPPGQSAHRSKGREETTTSTLERVPDPQMSLDRVWEQEWATTLTDAALERLKPQVSPMQFQIFYLHCVKGQATSTVARALGVSTGQVYLVKHRLKGMFEGIVRRLKDDWG